MFAQAACSRKARAAGGGAGAVLSSVTAGLI